MQPISMRNSALLVVDVQQGFTALCPRELPVPGGLEIVPAINRLLALDWARIDAQPVIGIRRIIAAFSARPTISIRRTAS